MPSPLTEPLVRSIISLGYDLFAMKMYWVAISALWLYEYCLTLPDEIEYAWTGEKSPVFWLFMLNRYLCPVFIIITLFAYFLDSWTLDVCARYGFMETLETAVLTCIAEVFLTIRVYALLGKQKLVLVIPTIIIMWQWAIALYAMSQSSKGTDQPALLLSPPSAVPTFPTLPNIDPYHICIFISTLTVTPWVEAYLCLCLAFDGLAFIGIIYGVIKRTRQHAFKTIPLIQVIKRDGIMYFFVLFSSNLVWLLLLLHAPLGLKFIHNQPAMVVSSIMITRITLNLKRENAKQKIFTWGTRTFEHITAQNSNFRPSTSNRGLTYQHPESSEETALKDISPKVKTPTTKLQSRHQPT